MSQQHPLAQPHRVVALFGPTGVGKTDVAVALARRLRAAGERPVAVSADALQVYAGLERLTGVASPVQLDALEHRLISFLDVGERFSVAEYTRLAHAEIDRLLESGSRPIVVGGTGLYLRAALTELTLRPAPPDELRARWTREIESRGAHALHGILKTRSPASAAAIDRNDRHRIVRALELLDLGVDPAPTGRSQLWTRDTRHPTLLVGLVLERSELYRRIDARVEQIVAEGAIEEVRRAAAAGASETARKALGFRELLDRDIEGVKRRTRAYARRQLTWMRKLAGVRMLDIGGRPVDDVAGEIERMLSQA
ncbi:MAG TPA: tRNA (adenosine(37)-N6)-dimethylallyltransferase MiaA [Solirubrobacteraceae bacterium]|nr:tRNA (adenosine(37)-N6)-dimethylallyltransferase MiaA [Solirubrobacteraceae bacterium]